MKEQTERHFTANALSHLMIVLGSVALLAVLFFGDMATPLTLAICLTLAIPHSVFLFFTIRKLRRLKAGNQDGTRS